MTTTIEHKDIPAANLHTVARWVVADITARNALSVSSSDVGKFCWVQNSGHYVLVSASPVAWQDAGVALGYTAENAANKSTDGTFAANSDTLYPSQKAVKTYVSAMVSGLLDLRGSYDASSNLFPTTGGSGTAGAVLKGDTWFVSVPGVLGGKAVTVGDSFFADSDSPGQTAGNWSVLETNIGYVPEDSANKSTDGTMAANSATLYPSQSAVKSYVQSFALTNPQLVVYVDTDFTPTRATTEPTVTDQIFIPGVIKLGTSMQFDIQANGYLYGTNFANTVGLATVYTAGLTIANSIMGLSTSRTASGFSAVLNVLNGTVTWFAGFGLASLNTLQTAELTLTTNDYYHAGMLDSIVSDNLPINATGAKAICFSGCMNNGNWLACCQTSNINSTIVDTGIPCVQDVFHLFEIKATNTSCLFYIDGNLVATINTNIPQDDGNALNASFQCYAPAAHNNGFVIDNWRVIKVPSFTRTWTTH